MEEFYIVYSYETYEDDPITFDIEGPAFLSLNEAKDYVKELIQKRLEWLDISGSDDEICLYIEEKQYRIKRMHLKSEGS